MNLLSVGAAYGVMALFAGGGWFGSDLWGSTARRRWRRSSP